jgi:choline dehydrogenase-like flavoprotein
MPLAFRYFRSHRSYKPRSTRVGLILASEQIPCPDSRIRLGANPDVLGMRTVEVDWRIDGRELSSFRAFGRRVRDVFAERKLARITLDPELEVLDPSLLSRVTDTIHQMSTTRIGASAKDGVVDANLRVHGTENLYIAGASVFPATGFANPTLTAIALGIRLCHHIAGASAFPAEQRPHEMAAVL